MVKQSFEIMISELKIIEDKIDFSQVEDLAKAITLTDQVFTAGAGRSGEMMKCITKRLMHGNINAYVVGETTTPPANKGDLLIIGSGSGETESLSIIASKAKGLGVKVGLITTNPDSAIGKMADFIIRIPASTPKSAKENDTQVVVSKQPMANLFEHSLLLLGDSMAMAVGRLQEMSFDEMFARHANLE